MSRCTSHTPATKASRYGPDHCLTCGTVIVPEPCRTCDATGEVWSKASGWKDCKDCQDGIAKWESEKSLKELGFDDV
jgi:hypothetical protein